MPLIDARPGDVPIVLRPGNAHELVCTFDELPAGELTAWLDDTELDVDVVGDVATIDFAADATADLTRQVVWELRENDQVILTGQVSPSNQGTSRSRTAVTVTMSTIEVAVTAGPGAGAQGPPGADGADGVDGQDGADGLDGVAAAEAPITYDAPTRTIGIDQTALELDAGQLISGVLDDARIPSTITRDSELATAVANALVTLRNGAPEAFDTLMEIIDRLGDDEHSITSLLTTVGTKANSDASNITAAVWRAALDLEPGTDVQAYSARLATLAGRTDATEAAALRTAALDGTYAPLSGLPILAESYGAVADDATDNTTSLTNAVAAAKAAGRKLLLGHGIYRINGDVFDLDFHGATVEGAGAELTTIKQMSTTANGVTFTPVSGVNVLYGAILRGVTLEGPGSGTGIGVDLTPDGTGSAPKNRCRIDDVVIKEFGSHALATKNTDYLTLIGVRTMANGGDGWYGDTATNATTVIGGTLGSGSTTSTPPVGKAGVRSVDMDGTTFIGTEFTQSEYGLIVTAGGTQSMNFVGCRFEDNSVCHAEIGEGTATYPTTILFQGSSFLDRNTTHGDGLGLTPMVRVNDATVVTFDSCKASGSNASGVLCKAVTDSNNSKIYFRRTVFAGGGNRALLEDSAGNKTTAGEDINHDGSYERRHTSSATVHGGEIFERTTSSSPSLRSRTTGDTQSRWEAAASGTLKWGSGTAATDTELSRSAADLLAMSSGDSFKVDGTWNGGKLRHGSRRVWVDAEGAFRTKTSDPASDFDGTLVSDPAADWTLPTGAKAQTFRRGLQISNLGALLSGALNLVAVYLHAGDVVSTITFLSSSTAAVTPTNQWFALYDAARTKLAVTNDDTTTAWGSATLKTLTLTSPYTVTTSGLYYLGVCVVAATVPSLGGQTASGIVTGIAPVMSGRSSTGLTDPASAPATAGSITAQNLHPWAYCS